MIGRLDQIIDLERAVKSPDGGGGTERTFESFDEANDPHPWARVVLKAGGEGEAQGRPSARVVAEFTIRSRGDVTERDRIRWDGRVWNITSLGRNGARAKYQTITAVAGDLS